MAIGFDPATRVITLDSFNVSASEIWSRWVDWVVLLDNSKYPPAFSQLGGVAPVALYLFLENGWRVRPQELDGQTTVTGNLLVQGGGNPFIATVGNFASQIVLEAPLAAQAIEVNTGSGITAQDKIDIVNQIYARVIENGETLEESLRLIRADAAGEITSDPQTGDYVVKSADGTVDRITGNGSSSGRAITVDAS